MRNLLVLLFIPLLGFTQAAQAQNDHIAIFKNVSGDIRIIRDDKEIVPVAGTQLMRSDKIRSGADSTAGIVFRDGTHLTLGSSSEIKVNQYIFQPEDGKYAFSVYLDKGSAIYSSGKIGKISPQSVSINTPRATVGVRGTRFIVKVE
ncbi:MAG TPA: FecR family protein [Burkholderiales bacterium]|nr:FecR family protein [Burkholderiales bacterium]